MRIEFARTKMGETKRPREDGQGPSQDGVPGPLDETSIESEILQQ